MATVQFGHPRGVAAALLVVLLLVQTAESQLCGGQVTAPLFTMSPSQRIPSNPASSLVAVATVSFTLATALPSSTVNAITVTYPAGFFLPSAGTVPIVACSGGSTFPTATVAMSSTALILSTTNAWDISPKTCVFSNIATGPPTDGIASCGVSIRSIADAPSASVSAGALGGQVTAASMTLSSRVPFSTSTFIASFITQTQLLVGDTVTMNFPTGFMSSGSPNVQGFPASINIQSGFAVMSVFSAVPAGSHTATVVGVALGPPMKASTTGFTVSTSKDRVSSGSPSVSLGGIVSAQSFIAAAADRIAFASGKTLTVTFTIATALSSSHFITISWPAGYLLPSAFGVTSAANVFASNPTSIGSVSALIAVVGNAVAGGSYAITLTGVTFGGPIAASLSCGVAISTTNDLAGSSGYPAIGGQISAVSWSIAAADRIPNTVKPITISFTIQSQLIPGDTITVNYPTGFISGNPQSIVGIAASSTSVGASSFVLQLQSAIAAGPVSVTVTFTLGAPTAGSASGVSVSTTRDLVSSGVSTGALGGRITAVSLTIAAADRIPFATSKVVTVSFVCSTALLPTMQVTIAWPPGYIAAVLGGVVSNAFTGTVSALGGGNGAIISVGSNAVVAGAHTVTLTGVTLGGPTAAPCGGLWVQSSADARSTISTALPPLGGQISNVLLQIAASDRIPQTSTTITISFTTQTPLSSGSAVTVTYPANSFVSGVPAIAAQSPAAAFASVVLTPPDSFVLTVAAALPSTATVVTLSGVTLGGPADEKTFYVHSTTDRFGKGVFPALGGRVSAVSMSMAKQDRIVAATGKAVTIAFTTQTRLVAGSLVTLE